MTETVGGFSGWGVMTLVATSSVLAALLTQGLAGWRDWMSEKRNDRFSALYLALALEAYAEACSALIDHAGNFDRSDGHMGRPARNVDELPEYPEIEWKALGIKDAVAVMSFRTELDSRRSQIIAVREFLDDDDDITAEACRAAAEFGLKAGALAKRLRKTRRLPKLPDTSVHEHLSSAYADYQAKDKVRTQTTAGL